MSSSHNNKFSILEQNYDEEFTLSEYKGLLSKKKAEKKLREIERLKAKQDLTPDEKLKVQQADYWYEIIHGKPIEIKPIDADADKKRLKREKEKQRKEIEKIKIAEEQLKREIEKRKRIEEEKIKEIERKQKIKDDYYAKCRKQQKQHYENNRKQFKENLENDFETNFDYKLQEKNIKKTDNIFIEYTDTLKELDDDNDKTFKSLSKKYHPDRNFGNTEWATENMKKLCDLRSLFSDLH